MRLLICFLFLPLVYFAQPDNGQRAISFTLEDTKGREVSLSDYEGKLVLLDFWASWCKPCREENPNVVEAYEKYNDVDFVNGKELVVLSVSLDKNEKDWKKAIEKDDLKWDSHVWDSNKKVTKTYGVRSIPYSFLIDGEGKILAQGNELRGLNLHITIEKYIE
ncbi:MAG: TlpA family protein disulfide reductase [Bacteroidota bacterium]